MPYVQFAPAYSHFAKSDPVADFIAAALGAEAPKSKSAACAPASCQRRLARVIPKRIINPHFDVSELENDYVLEGELPGVSDKSSITISFDDAQTIVVKGEIKRVSREAPKQELTEAALQASAAQSESKSEEQQKSKRHSVTVEDEVDESETASNASFEVVDGPTPSKADKGKAAATESADVEMTEEKSTEQPKEETKPATPAAKYWVSERPIGVFERRFNFQGLIDQDNVKAHLENGLLTVVIPKRQPYVRQVFIN